MIESDQFKTIKSSSEGLFKDRGSKFIAFAFRVNSITEVNKALDHIKKEYRDARHHCYAYKIGHGDDIWRVNDDGEPSGTAGKPILGQINSFEITNTLIVVIRYFGGTLLGVGGLINAYRSAAKDALQNGKIVSELIKVTYDLDFPYAAMNEVMTLIKDKNLSQSDQVFELDCSIRITFRKSMDESICRRLSSIKDLKYTLII